MRDQAAPETLGAERDELVSNVLLGGAKLTAGATGKDGSGSDKVHPTTSAWLFATDLCCAEASACEP